jgi:DNA repair exonuclease SbcCD nuclease subunit
MFKFLHAADIHLDSPLLGLDRYEGAPVEAIRGAARKAFCQLVQLAKHERVDFVVLAGDIYDGNWLDYNTGLFFVKEVRELGKAGIPVVFIRGNHDAESRITSQLTLPPNVHELPTDRPATIPFEKIGVAVHGQGFARQAETRNLAAEYPSPVSGCFNIGMLHTALNGREGHATYAPCAVDQLIARDYDYWALGHVHQRESVNGSDRVRVEFPGNIQGRNIRETGEKGCLLVTVDDAKRAQTSFRSLDVFRWAEVSVDGVEASSLTDAVDIAVRTIDDERQNAEGRPLAVRVRLTCSASIYRRVAEDLDQFRFELAARAGDQVWIEKIKPKQVDEPGEGAPTITGAASSELRATLEEYRSNPEAIKAVFSAGDCGRLRKALPSELRNILDDKNYDEIVERATVFLGGSLKEEDE